MANHLRLVLVVLLASTNSGSAADEAGNDASRTIIVTLYVDSTKTVAPEAMRWLSDYAAVHQGFQIKRIDTSKPAGNRNWKKIVKELPQQNCDLPAVHVCGSTWHSPTNEKAFVAKFQDSLRCDIYKSGDCAACDRIEILAGEIADRYPGLQVAILQVDSDQKANQRLQSRYRAAGLDPNRIQLPAFDVINVLLPTIQGPKSALDQVDEIMAGFVVQTRKP
jgi:hypothetical protein